MLAMGTLPGNMPWMGVLDFVQGSLHSKFGHDPIQYQENRDRFTGSNSSRAKAVLLTATQVEKGGCPHEALNNTT
jgi:hypothetical protein